MLNNLKINVMNIHTEYKQMIEDGQIDIKELDILISEMTSLMKVVNNIQLERLTEKEKKILTQISSIILAGKEKMNNIRLQYGLQEEREISTSGYGR